MSLLLAEKALPDVIRRRFTTCLSYKLLLQPPRTVITHVPNMGKNLYLEKWLHERMCKATTLVGGRLWWMVDNHRTFIALNREQVKLFL